MTVVKPAGRACLGPAEFFGELSNVEAVHLEFERAERNPQVAGRGGDVPRGFFEGPENEITFERVRGFFKAALAAARHTPELGGLELERQLCVGDPIRVG